MTAISASSTPIRRRRGMAMIVAISVLAILTIIVMGLAASQRASRQLASIQQTKQKALELIRLGLDSAMVQLKKPGGSVPPNAYKTREGEFTLTAFAIDPQEELAKTLYDGKYLQHRPGDTLLTVSASVLRGPRRLQMEHLYLVNAAEGRERRIRLDEKFHTLKEKKDGKQ